MDIAEEAIQDKSQDTELNGPNLSTTKECSSFETEQLKALAMMKDNLPDYIVESFIEAGFDTLDVIAEIDTENTNSTLVEIEQFITREFKEDVRFQCGISVTGHFKFLPGHRRQVNNFIKKVKEEVANKKMKIKFRTKSKKASISTEIRGFATSLKKQKLDFFKCKLHVRISQSY